MPLAAIALRDLREISARFLGSRASLINPTPPPPLPLVRCRGNRVTLDARSRLRGRIAEGSLGLGYRGRPNLIRKRI